jgi:hypothetical protein
VTQVVKVVAIQVFVCLVKMDISIKQTFIFHCAELAQQVVRLALQFHRRLVQAALKNII